MATNPKVPDFQDLPRRKQDEPTKLRMLPQSKFPWPTLILIAGALLLITVIARLPKVPHATKPPAADEVPRQPTAEQIQLSNQQITPAPAGDGLYLTAFLHNTGKSEITGVQLGHIFWAETIEALLTERHLFRA